MQNRNVGDIGDFGKYAVLKALAGADLRLGINWYLNPDEELKNDGQFTQYRRLRSCDPHLYHEMAALATNSRSVKAVAAHGRAAGSYALL